MNSVDPTSPLQEAGPLVLTERESPFTRFSIGGIFAILVVGSLYFAREFFIPVVLAFLIAMTLTPIVRFLKKRGVPAGISATLLIIIATLTLALIGYLLSGPVIDLISNAPATGHALRERLSEIRHPFEKILNASNQIDQAAGGDDPSVQRVVVQQPGVLSWAAGNLPSVGTTLGITLVLALFLLASGSLFYEKIIQSFAYLSAKKRALRVVFDIEKEISRYLFTFTLINIALGLVVGTGLWLIGVPNPIVWGVTTTLLNYLPYIGPLLNIGLVSTISLVTFPQLSHALLAPAFILTCNVIEGQFLTPVIMGRRLELNAVAIFIALAFWSWLWGIIGALMAVPLLVVIKVFCDHFESLTHIGNFLSAQQTAEEAEALAEPVPAETAAPTAV